MKKRFLPGPTFYIVIACIVAVFIAIGYGIISGGLFKAGDEFKLIKNIIAAIILPVACVIETIYLFQNASLFIEKGNLYFSEQKKISINPFSAFKYIFKPKKYIRINDIESLEIIRGAIDSFIDSRKMKDSNIKTPKNMKDALYFTRQPLIIKLKNGDEESIFMKQYMKSTVKRLINSLVKENPDITLSKTCEELIK